MQSQHYNIILFTAIVSAILLLLLSFVAVIVFLCQKKNMHYYKQLESAKDVYEKKILETQLETQEQTFHNISKEIHDNIGLFLTLAKLQLNTIDYSNTDKTPEDVNASIDLIGNAINNLGDISKGLHSDAIKMNGLYNTLKTASEKINRPGKHHIEFTGRGNIVFLDANKELILYRIAQEALNNILKHANASHIWVKLLYEKNHISLSIEDNGTGFDKVNIEKSRIAKMHTGLNNMRSRAQMLNGRFYIITHPGKGTKICINAPY